MISQADFSSRHRRSGRRRTLLAVMILVVAVGLTAGCKSSSAKKVGGVAPSSASTSGSGSSANTFKIGDQVQAGKWIVTVHGVKNPYTSSNQFISPSAGNVYVVVDVEVKNTDSKTQTLSSLLSFSLKDSANKTYDESLPVDTAGAKIPEGDIAAGESLRGNVAFEVPSGAKGLSFVFKSSAFGGATATIALR